MELTVLIPTYNRAGVLRRCLKALLAQEVPGVAWEIVVVDDGSTDATPQLVQGVAADAPVPVRYLRQANRGPAAARNRGIRAARGRLLLMTDSDIVAASGLLAAHLAAHRRHPQPEVAVLGLVQWSPEHPVTPFMRWWERVRFRYHKLLEKREPVNHTYFYTCNVSVKREFLLAHGLFDEAFPSAAYEDSELAHRLWRRGLRLVFVPEALAYHDHPTDFAHACRQMEAIGRSAPLYRARTGQRGLPKAWDWIGRTPLAREPWVNLLRPLAERLQYRAAVPPVYVPVLMHHFRRGWSMWEQEKQREHEREARAGHRA